MTHFAVFVPLAVAFSVALVMTVAHRWLQPRVATRFVTAAVAMVVVAVVPTILAVSLAFVTHLPRLSDGLGHCVHAVGLHGSVPMWLGLGVAAVAVSGAVRVWRVVREYRSLRVDCADPVHIAVSDTPYAVTLPGRAGQIVISTALMEMLDERERRVVVAHEKAHAANRHDRYLLVAEVAASIFPPLRTMARRIVFSAERWADESAAVECGDRAFVARTLGKVAVTRLPRFVAGLSGLGVAARMAALGAPPVVRPPRVAAGLMWMALAAVAGLSAYQMHHVVAFIATLCAF